MSQSPDVDARVAKIAAWFARGVSMDMTMEHAIGVLLSEVERLRAAKGSHAAPLPPEVLADALQDRIGPSSGKLIHASPIRKAARPSVEPREEPR